MLAVFPLILSHELFFFMFHACSNRDCEGDGDLVDVGQVQDVLVDNCEWRNNKMTNGAGCIALPRPATQ